MNRSKLAFTRLLAWAALMGRRARLEAVAPKTIRIPRGHGWITQEREMARRRRQLAKYGERYWGPPIWQGDFQSTFNPGNR